MTTSPQLTEELHVHLYGCLTPEALWELGRDRAPQVPERLKWYADEYEKACGRRPDPLAYWRAEDGLERLKADFLAPAPLDFPAFQARFNLSIALFPIGPKDVTVLRHVLLAQRQQGIRYGEYRCFLPPHLTMEQVAGYILSYGDEALAIARDSGTEFLPRLAFSLSRDVLTALRQHQVLRRVVRAKPALAEVIVGLDFCGAECGQPPRPMKPVFDAIHAANRAEPSQALAVLYHVGEIFDDLSLASSARWVAEAHSMGVHRLGHATSLGVEPTVAAQGETELVSERLDHLSWLISNASWLRDYGLTLDLAGWRREKERLGAKLPVDRVDVVPGDERGLQNALMTVLARRGAVIESCPTSNIRLGRLPDAAHHPLPRFLAHGLKTVVGSDDPGLFGVTLGSEGDLCQQQLGLSSSQVAALAATARDCRAAALVRPR